MSETGFSMCPPGRELLPCEGVSWSCGELAVTLSHQLIERLACPGAQGFLVEGPVSTVLDQWLPPFVLNQARRTFPLALPATRGFCLGSCIGPVLHQA